MSVAYEPRTFSEDSLYAPVGENEHDFTTDANVSDVAELAAYNATEDHHSAFDASGSPALDLTHVAPPNVDPSNVPITPTDHNGATLIHPTTSRSKPIAKPDREVTKNEDGKYVCTFPECKEELRTFQRKCEWSKHMDKHERPYVCTVKGCEKVQGFTYSGGLLRHEREVHNKHGGPKKPLHCPHANCKRNAGKGFSRQENLQEHLRRVHTVDPLQANSPDENNTDDNASDVASAAFAAMAGVVTSPDDTSELGEAIMLHKRKRSVDDVGHAGDDGEIIGLRQEVKRLTREKAELKRQLQEMTRSYNDVRAQLQSTHDAISQTLAVPQPPVL